MTAGIWAAPGDRWWTVERAVLSAVTSGAGTAGQLGLDEPGEYLIVRRNGRTVRWARDWGEVAATGFPVAGKVPATAAYPPPVFDAALARRRERKRLGGTAEHWARRDAADAAGASWPAAA